MKTNNRGLPGWAMLAMMFGLCLMARPGWAQIEVQTAIQNLAEAEKLWPSQPEDYFKQIKDDVNILCSSLSNQAVWQPLSKV